MKRRTDEQRLTDFVDLAALQALQDGFARMTGISTAIRDADGQPITVPAAQSEFCRLIQSCPSGSAACAASHDAAAKAPPTISHAGPNRHECHAGLAQFVAPIIVAGRHLGSISVGDRPVSRATDRSLSELAAQHGIDAAALRAAAADLPPWDDGQMLAATQFVQQLADTIARLCYQTHELARRVEEMAVVRELAAMLARQSKLQDILDAATAQLVSSMNLRAAAIRLLDEDTGVLKMASVANLSREYLDKGQILAMDSPIDQAALAGETVYIDDLRSDPRVHHQAQARAEGLISALVTPLAHGGKPIGVLRAYMSRAHQFTPPEVSLLEAIASQVAAAIANARLHRDAEQAVRLDRQIKTAGEVQRRMIPATPPTHAHYKFGCVYDPSYDVGGDFFDFIRFDNGDIGVAIADVVGKGVPASLMMASVRSALRSHARRVTDISDIIRSVNRRLCHDTLPGEFATAFYLELTADGRLLKFCNAGHEPLLLLRDGRIEELDVGGLALGVVEDAAYESAEMALLPGDALVLATDGVLEALNYEGEAFGRSRLHNSIRLHGAMANDMPVQMIASQIQWDVRRFTGLAPVTDDLTLVVVRVLGASAA